MEETTKKLHVLVIPTWYPNGADRLIGVYHLRFCEALHAYGIRADMLYVDRQGLSAAPRYPTMPKYFETPGDGYTVYGRRMLDLSRVIGFDAAMQSYVRQLDRLYRRYERAHGRPDVLHAQVAVPAGYAAAVLGEKYGIPVVVTEHASYFRRFFTGKEGRYWTYVKAHAAKITCVAAHMQEAYRAQGTEAEVLPNVVDCRVFSGPRRKNPDGRLRFATVCALRRGKRIDDLIEALALLREKKALPPFLCTVVGDGFEAYIFREAAERLHMTDVVEFVGRKTQEEIAEILSGTDIFVMPSELESFGIPVVEALAAGVPVVCTRCKGPEEFLTPEVSELCRVKDPEDLAAAILRMTARLPEISEAALRDAARQFDAASVAEKAESIYRAAISGQ